jgi:uncharacterized membrane protein
VTLPPGLCLASASLVQPNLHVAVIHFPIALLAAGVLAEIAGLIVGASSLRSAARWMVLLGSMAALPVSLSGIYAINDIVRSHAGDQALGTPWHDALAATTLAPPHLASLLLHAKLQLLATAIALAVSFLYLAGSESFRRLIYLPALLLMLAVVGATTVGAHIAGQVVYQGVTVTASDESAAHHPTASASTSSRTSPPTFPPASAPTSAPTTQEINPLSDLEHNIAYLAPPLQVHVLLAGSVLSLGLMSLACAYRNASSAAPDAGPKPTLSRAMTRPTPTLLPASRLLLLTAAFALLTASAGAWHFSRESETTSPSELWTIAVPFPPRDALKAEHRSELRRPLHIASGSALVLLPLTLAGYLALRPRSRIVLTLGLLVFLTAASAQLLSGALLLLDTPSGTLTTLNPASS